MAWYKRNSFPVCAVPKACRERLPELLLEVRVDIGRQLGRWRFVFLRLNGTVLFGAEDIEPGTWGERLELLTLIRALESLDRPSLVFLLHPSPYLEEGIRFGLPQWRANNWQWEHFDQWVPIRNVDLWHRLDWALQFHQLVVVQTSEVDTEAGGGRWPLPRNSRRRWQSCILPQRPGQLGEPNQPQPASPSQAGSRGVLLPAGA